MSAVATLRDYSSATTALAERAGLDLLAAWGSIETFADVETVKAIIGPTYYALIQRYGSAASSLAAYVAEEVLSAPAVAVSTDSALAAAPASLRWSLGPLYGDLAKIRPGDALTLLDGTLTRHVLAPGRETMTRATAKAGVRFKRVLSGAKPCDFCKMLAGRGAVYHNERAAGDLTDFHDRCKCDIAPAL